MKSTVRITAGIFCFVMAPVAIIGGMAVTLAMPEVYRAIATISVKAKGEEMRSHEKLILNELAQTLNSDSCRGFRHCGSYSSHNWLKETRFRR